MKKGLIVLASLMLLSTNIFAKEVEVKSMTLDSMSIQDVRIYASEDRIDFLGWLSGRKIEGKREITYSENIHKTDIQVMDQSMIINDLNMKGEFVKNRGIIFDIDCEELELDDRARENIYLIKSSLESNNEQNRLNITYANIETMMQLLSIVHNFQLYYTEDDQVIISEELVSGSFEKKREDREGELNKFIIDSTGDQVYSQYFIPYELSVKYGEDKK